MSFDKEAYALRDVDDTDNRDPTTTILKLSDGSCVEVNPVELFRNMLQNLQDGESLEKSFNVFMTQINLDA